MHPGFRAGIITCFGFAGISILVAVMNIEIERMITPPPDVTIPFEMKLDAPWAHIGCCCTPLFTVVGVLLLLDAPQERLPEK